jgi:hypothetical protein
MAEDFSVAADDGDHDETTATSPTSPVRPVLEPAALHGLPGEVVRTIEPHTEADPAALLLHFLAMFGNAVGSGPHLLAGSSPQPPRLFVCIVGDTARGRKGTAGDEVEHLMRAAEPEWAERLLSGARSAEAIISEVDDTWARDRRLCIFETEFGRLLATMSRREGMSSVLKDAYDGKTLRIRTKNQKGWRTATRPHVSLIGHITPGELADRMPEVELTSGFANRILYGVSARSKRLTHGGVLRDEGVFEDLAMKVHGAVEFANEHAFTGQDPISAFLYRYLRRQPQVTLAKTPAGLVRWEQLYDGPLDVMPPGVLGEILARAPVNVLRLATAYALADRSPTVDAVHVDAAYAVWRYCEASAMTIFGTLTGSRDVDRLLRALLSADGHELSRTDISGVFHHHRSARALDDICERLLNSGWVTHRRRSQSPSHNVDLYTLTEEGCRLVAGESAK